MRFVEEVQEETDSRIVVHLAHMLQNNQISKIIAMFALVTVDTDAIIIILGNRYHASVSLQK